MASETTPPHTNDIALRRGCRCGNITYTSTTLPVDMANCHCQACRQISGGPYITWADFPVSSINWFSVNTSGSDTTISDDSAISEYSSNAIRGFCGYCGSTVRLWYRCDPARYSIAVGSIDEASVHGELPKVNRHLFLMEKASGKCWETTASNDIKDSPRRVSNRRSTSGLRRMESGRQTINFRRSRTPRKTTPGRTDSTTAGLLHPPSSIDNGLALRNHTRHPMSHPSHLLRAP